MSNAITFHGRLVKDAWTGATKDGKAMCRFTVASDTGFGDNAHTNYFDVVLFGKRAEGGLVPYLVKGKEVYVSGEIRIEHPKEVNGRWYNNMTVFPRDVDLLGGKGSQSGNDSSQGGGGSSYQEKSGDFDDDLPFVTRNGIL